MAESGFVVAVVAQEEKEERRFPFNGYVEQLRGEWAVTVVAVQRGNIERLEQLLGRVKESSTVVIVFPSSTFQGQAKRMKQVHPAWRLVTLTWTLRRPLSSLEADGHTVVQKKDLPYEEFRKAVLGR